MTEQTKSELKACPFCGSDRINLAPRQGFPVQTECFACRALGPMKITGREADEAWNTRTPATTEVVPLKTIDEVCGAPKGTFQQSIEIETLKLALEDEKRKVRIRDANYERETDLTAEPNPNGTVAARLNWWKARSDEAQEEISALRSKLQSASELIERLSAIAVMRKCHCQKETSIIRAYICSRCEILQSVEQFKASPATP